MVHKNLIQKVNLRFPPPKKKKKNPFRHCTFVTCEPDADNPGIILSHSPRKISFYLMKNYFMYLKYCSILVGGGVCNALLYYRVSTAICPLMVSCSFLTDTKKIGAMHLMLRFW